jgi:hypothetical protein
MHGHALIRRLIVMIRELRKEREYCTCGGADGLISGDAEQVQGQVRLTT